MQGILSAPFSVPALLSKFIFLFIFPTTHLCFSIVGEIFKSTQHQQKQQYIIKQNIKKIVLLKNSGRLRIRPFTLRLQFTSQQFSHTKMVIFPISKRGRCAGQRRCSVNFSDANAGSLKHEEDSISLATLLAVNNFSNSLRVFSYP